MQLCDNRSGLKRDHQARKAADPIRRKRGWQSATARHKPTEDFSSLAVRAASATARAFTLMEVMVVMVLFTILIVSGFSAILSMKMWSNRLADYTAAMAVVEAKVEDIRAAIYNPSNYLFGLSTRYLTNSGS